MGILTCVTGTLIPAGRPCPLHGEDPVRAGCDQEETEAWELSVPVLLLGETK